jgi:hypothetical protein
MLPVTQLTLGAALGAALAVALAPADVDAADVSLAAVVAVGVTAGELAEGDAPVDEHAVTTSAAATVRALNRRVPFSNVVSPLPLGQFRCDVFSEVPAGWSEAALNGALADC